jgi:signal transduction histidine kinase
MNRGWPLALRLLIPLAVLAVIFSGAVAIFLIQGVSARLDRETDERLASLADTLAVSSYVLDREILLKVREVTGAEVLTLAPDGSPSVSTLPPGREGEMAELASHRGAPRNVILGGEPYRLVTGRVLRATEDEKAPGFLVAVAASTRPFNRLKRRVAWTIVVATGTGLALLLLAGHVIVRTATRPLARLVEAAREIGRGDLTRRIEGGGGREIDVLAAEIDSMVHALARSRAELVQAERLAVAGKMAASVAHEIRNPLSSIRMNVQLLARKAAGTPEVAAELQDVLDEVDRLDLVLSNLLDLTSPPRFLPAPQSLNVLIETVLRLTSRKLEHLNAEVHTDFAPDLPRLPLDAHKVRQAFLNVILNAAEAMPQGGTLSVSTRVEGAAIEAVFEDTGAGMGAAAATRAFEPFFSTKPAGAGLGLHIVANVMELHSGRAYLEPAGPRGTRCVMVFPLAVGTAGTEALAEAAPAPKGGSPA